MLQKLGLGASSLLLAVLSFFALAPIPAHAIDVTEVVTEIEAAAGPIGLIGVAVLLVLAAIAAFKWVRRAF